MLRVAPAGTGSFDSVSRALPAKTPLRMTDREVSLRPDDIRDGIFRGGGTGISRAGIGSPEFVVELDTFESAIDYGFKFVRVFHFAALGQAALGFRRAEPGGMSIPFVGAAHLVDF